MMKQRFLYLWLPHLVTDRYAQDGTALENGPNVPFATVTSDHRGVLLAGLNAAALKEKLLPQMRLTDARAICPALQTQPIAPEKDRAFLQDMAKTADMFTPWVALDGPHSDKGEGGLWLEITGAAHLFGGEERMMERVKQVYAPYNCTLRLGMADSALAAWAAARFHKGTGRLSAYQTYQETQSFPLQALDLAPDLIQRLNRLGLRTLADIRDIPRANMTVRFGYDIIKRLDQLVGTLPFQLTYQHAPRLYEEIAFFAEPLGSQENVAQTVERLLARLCVRLKKENIGLRRLGAQFTRVDGRLSFFQVATSSATFEPAHLMRLLQGYLPGVDTGFGIERVHLRALQTQWQDNRQADLNDASNQGPDKAAQHALIDRLRHRLGADCVSYPAHHHSHIPERALHKSPTPTAREDKPDYNLPKRPIRLLSPPEPLNVLATDAANMPVRGQWRRMSLSFSHLTGPERITREWWRKLSHDLWDAQLGMRDYFRAEDQEGRNLWLCRVTSQAREIRWFVHGWFG